jgi:hypothetical protein
MFSRLIPMAVVLGLLSAGPVLAVCGDSVVDGSEECDLGPGNGSPTSCCTTLCEFRAEGTTCRPLAGSCDIAETCTGTSATCPADMFQPINFVCRAAVGGCDVDELCSGVDAICPPDALRPAGFECRDEAGVCDVAEVCDGSDPDCPADVLTPAGTVCRTTAGDCDTAETCTGSSPGCPADALTPAGTVCRAAASPCDAAETCTGSNVLCPADVFQPNGTPCTDASPCTDDDACFQGVCVGTQDLDACLDDFIFYKAKNTPQTPRFTPISALPLVDQFETGNVDVSRPRGFMTPADKNGEGTNDAATHMIAYKIKPVRGSPRHVPKNVRIENQLGPLFLTTQRAEFLLVPTAKSLTGEPPEPPYSSHEVDHYKCYRARVTIGAPKFPENVTVLATDQFRTAQGTFRLDKVRHLCNPVDKDGEGIKNPTGHFVCYTARGIPRSTRARGLYANNQFGPGRFDTQGEQELCIPSTKEVIP